MGTVAKRTMRSTPHRHAAQTWAAIVELLSQGRRDAARTETPLGKRNRHQRHRRSRGENRRHCHHMRRPRTRIYCLYDDAAIDGSDANEDALGFDPLKGDWAVSLPCLAEDLAGSRTHSRSSATVYSLP